MIRRTGTPRAQWHRDLILYGEFLWTYTARKLGSFLPNTRISHPLSKALRPLVQSHKFRTIAGANLAAAIVVVSLMGDIGGQVNLEPVETTVLTQNQIQILTETRFRFPLATWSGYSQGFHRFHLGVDIRAPRGTAIYPVTRGRVIEVELNRWGYGHKVIVYHQDESLTTLYAHLDAVYVRTGDQVSKDTVLGEVGMTGWTTGPHLHFETINNNKYLNPKQILPAPSSTL